TYRCDCSTSREPVSASATGSISVTSEDTSCISLATLISESDSLVAWKNVSGWANSQWPPAFKLTPRGHSRDKIAAQRTGVKNCSSRVRFSPVNVYRLSNSIWPGSETFRHQPRPRKDAV